MDKETVKEGPWWVSHITPEGMPRMSIGFVVSNTETYLTLSPDRNTVGNEIVIETRLIRRDGPLVPKHDASELLQYLASRQCEHEEHVVGEGASARLQRLMEGAGLHYTKG